MTLRVAVGGAGQLEALARRAKEAGRKDLGKELLAGVKKAPAHIEKAVIEAVPFYMPKGYEKVFAASLRFTTRVSARNGYQVTIKATAKGAKGRYRQVKALEGGSLRHPVFGRTRRVRRHWVYRAVRIENPWVAQRIRPRFFTQPALTQRFAVRKDIEQAMANVAQKIEKG